MERFRTYTWDASKKSHYYGLGGRLLPHDKTDSDANLIVHQVVLSGSMAISVNKVKDSIFASRVHYYELLF